MASETEIANMALGLLGDEGEISSLTEDSRAARAIAGQFQAARDATLRAHPWNFARQRAVLPMLAEAPAWGGWNAFQKPADFLRFIETEACPYLLEGDCILARQSGPLHLLYIRRVTDSGRFDGLFVDVLAAEMAARVAIRLTGDRGLRDRMEEEARTRLAEARRVNGQERPTTRMAEDDWLLARERG